MTIIYKFILDLEMSINKGPKEETPCIVGLRHRFDSAKWANYPHKDHVYTVIFTIYSLDEDILVTADGEYLKRGFMTEMNIREPNSFIVEFDSDDNKDSNTYFNSIEREYIFDPPRKITYFINYISNISESDYARLLQFKCPKAGSLSHDRIIHNKAIQKLLLNESNLLVVFLDETKNNKIFDEYLNCR
jgi:hypothetical protein